MIGVVVYECDKPLRDSERFMAFLVQEVYLTDKRVRTGETRKELLPVRFTSKTYHGAKVAALAFWNDENAKKQAKITRGKELGLSRRNSIEANV